MRPAGTSQSSSLLMPARLFPCTHIQGAARGGYAARRRKEQPTVAGPVSLLSPLRFGTSHSLGHKKKRLSVKEKRFFINSNT
jgi:hypothetical protein